MEKKNNSPALIAMLTCVLSMLLIISTNSEGEVPDYVIRVLGVAVLIALGVSAFFVVRAIINVINGRKNRKESE